MVSQDHGKKPRPSGCQETQTDQKEPGPDSFHLEEGPADQWPKDKAISTNLQAHQGELAASHVYRTPVVHGFEELLQSFEEYCQESQHRRKKRKTGKTSATAQRGKEPDKDSQSTSRNPDLAQSSPLLGGNKSEELQPAEGATAKWRKVSTEALPASPELPFPSLQVHSSAPPVLDGSSCLELHGEALSTPQREEETGLPGLRVHARMPVFAGSKRDSLLPTATLYQQDMQGLGKDMDSTSDVRGGPYSVLEPGLEKRTPDELCRLEKDNPAAVGETDELWKMHCLKDHKGERPQEHETWQEMYLRLQDAREQRLQALSKRIQSAQAREPQGRRTQMILFASVGKPPREVAGRQERLGIPGEAPLSTGSSNTPSSRDSNPPGNRPTGACPNTVRPPLAHLLNTKKPTAKKLAPLMAKTIKDYKKRMSRR